MNVVKGIRAVARLGSTLVNHSKTPMIKGLVGKTATGSVTFLPRAIFVAPLIKPRLEIIDPLSGILGEINTPSRRNENFIIPPKPNDTEVVEPPGKVIEKRAARLIVIRRRKMKKHKWRKLQKRMKFVYAKKRQKKELKKEKEFQAVLLAKIKEAEKFSADEYVTSRLKTAHWEKPITRVRGYYAPESVIREFQQAQKDEKRVKDRIEYCLRMKE